MRTLLTSLKTSSIPLWAVALFLFPVVALAQVATATSSTVAPSLTDLLEQGQHTYKLFETGAILAGVSAVINLLVNISKMGPINDWIVRKRLKWIRLVAALVLGFLAGLSTALAQGMKWHMAAITALIGLGSGGGAVVIHELVSMLKGNRS